VVDTLFVETDAKDWDAVRALFINDIDVDFSSLGGVAETMPADDLVAGWNQGLHALKESHHMTSNPLVSVDGDTAEVITQGYAYNRLTGDAAGDAEGTGFWEVWGTYTISFVHTDTGWKMNGLTFDAKYSQGDASVPGHTLQ
jgi:hypothetical protein